MENDKKQTWADFAREVFPEANDEDAMSYLFNVTAFPCSMDKGYLMSQLIEFRDMPAEEWNKENGDETGIYKTVTPQA